MYGGYNNYGMGGMGGGMGGMGGMRGGGQEMMIMCCCCCLCLCLLCCFGGYWANLFCSISSSLGRSCGPKEPSAQEQADAAKAASEPSVPEPSPVSTCNDRYGPAARGPSDPRPPYRPEACAKETRATGRDCYFWKVENDAATGLARWMRVTDGSKGDMYDGGKCTPTVKCTNVIDPTSLVGYSETDPAALLKQCSAVPASSASKAEAIAYLTSSAKKAGPWATASRNYATPAWGKAHSEAWFNRVERYVGLKNLTAYIDNSVKAAVNLKAQLRQSTMAKSTFAAILEAAVRSPDNRAEWIVDAANSFASGLQQGTAARTETSVVAYLNKTIRLQDWAAILNTPALQ